jgi:hypothetical protein
MQSSSSRWGRPSQSKARSGVTRTKLYKIAKKHKGLLRKLDDATIVDFDMLDRILAELPPAELGHDKNNAP